MREWINFKVQQFNNDTYLNDELSTIEQQTLKYKIFSLHPYLYKGESAKNLEKYICELLKREYAKNLATQIENNKFIYGNNMTDVMSFAKRFIQTYSDVYDLNSKADAINAGTSIKELVKCYKELNNNLFDKKDLDDLTDFLLRLPTEIRIQSQYLDQYAPYYANTLKFFLSVLTTVFNIGLKQPKPQALSGFSAEIINTDKKRFDDWFDRFESEYTYENPVVQKDFNNCSAHIYVSAESFNNLKVYFKDIEFYAENTFQTITDLFLGFDYVRTLEFENCTLNFWFYGNMKSFLFKNCVFNDAINYNAKLSKHYQPVVSVLMFENCIFNSDVTIDDIKEGMSNTLILKDCRFAKNANFHLSNVLFLKTIFENNIFEGKVFFENIRLSSLNWKNLFFLSDFRNNKVVLASTAKISQILFGAKVVKSANKSISNFIKILRANKIADYATELENLYFNNMDTTKSKTEFDIAIQSNWLNMKQTASFLGISYATLLSMRKEDKATGIVRIPYIGEGKSTRYYVPLLQAYKDRNMTLVNQLAKEMETKK